MDSRYIIMHTSYVYSCPNDPIMCRYLFSHSCVPKFLCMAMHTHVDTRGSEYVYTRTHVCARASAVSSRTSAAPHRAPTERARCGGAPPAESGAYPGQRGERRDVPRADVRVERRRRFKRLRSTPSRTSAAPHRARPPRCGRRPKAAHTCCNEVTDTVFHAPMFALNVDDDANACGPRRRTQVPRRTEPRPSAPAAVARRRPKAAHTLYMFDTRAVFHAPISALNPVVVWNACEPSDMRSPPAESARTFRRRYTWAEAHAGARTHTRTHMCASMMRRHALPTRSVGCVYICINK